MNTTNTMDKVLTTLDGVNADECRRVMVDYDGFMNKVQHMIYIQTFIDHYKDADMWYVRGNNTAEKRSLIFARNIFESNNLENNDLRKEKLRDYVTGKLLTSEKMIKRLNVLRSDLWK